MNDEDEGGRIGLWMGVGVGVFIALATVFTLLGDDGGASQGHTAKRAVDTKPAVAVTSTASTAATAASATIATAPTTAAAAATTTATSALDAIVDLPLTGELMGKVYFEVGKATLDAEAQTTIDKAVKEITASTKPNRIVLSGFHDLSGDPAKNAELAKERAKAVRNAMTAKGVSADRVVLRKPAETGSGGSPAEARRVEIRLID